jgi:CRP-like cAMP-binding protein
LLNLTHIESFEGIDSDLLKEINQIGKIKTFLEGSPAFDSDDTLKHFYIILDGIIKVYRYNPKNNREQTLYLLKQNDFFDTLTLLDGNYHEVMTTVLETSKALELPIEKVREWINTKPEFNRAFFPYMAKQLREVEELATDISLYDTSTRLMKLLLKNIDSKNPLKELKLLQKLSHEELASMVGSVRAVVNRYLQQLKKEGIIDIKRKKIAINDVAKLLERVEDEYK